MSFGGERVHFVGIGGAGMSAIAKVLLERGHQVSGSDLKTSRAAAMLEAMGARVHVGHDAALVEDVDIVIVSSAITDKNPERRRATELGLTVLTRGEALAAVLEAQRSIIVAGTHGKTTTTSMAITALLSAGEDPTYLVGAGLNDIGTNGRSGTGDIAVAEADESDGSFLLLSPHIGVITNLELDHVDHWGSLEELTAAFERFMASVDPAGAVVVPASDQVLIDSARRAGRKVVTFGEGGHVAARDIEVLATGMRFELVGPTGSAQVDLRVPGLHNVSNACAAAAACSCVGIDVQAIARGLSAYRGVERRFQIRGEYRGATIVDDYAHHPTEVAATLEAARPGPWRNVVALFQPHRYSRTAALVDAFGTAFEAADRVILMDVYGAGEHPVPGVSGKLLADAVCRAYPGRPVAYFPHRAELLGFLEQTIKPGDVLLTLGAGDVSAIAEELFEREAGTA
jgi:UDP-N-acetylmuramate--alanine ligase